MRLRTTGLALAVLASMVACTSDGEDKAADDGSRAAAEQLAAALTSEEPESAAVEAKDPDAVEHALGGVAQVPHTVTAREVTSAEGKATATLDWSWEVGNEKWTYSTTAELVDDAGTWRTTWSPKMLAPDLMEGERLRLVTTSGSRGRILGQQGEVLVGDRPVVRYGLDKSRTSRDKWLSSATQIARAVKVDVKEFRERVRKAGDKAFVEALVLRAEQAATEIKPSYAGIPGAVAISDDIPLAPSRTFAAPILGTVGQATADIVEKSSGTIKAGDEVGLSGLQARYDDTLRPTVGARMQAVGTYNDARVLFEQKARDGKDLQLTIREPLQAKAENILETQLPAGTGDSALVAIRPSTGEILVAANGTANDGFNAATAGQYAPGSTFKVVSSLALLRSGMKPSDATQCPATITVDGRSFKNYDDYPASGLGNLTLRQAVANSCNTALIGERERLEPDTLEQAAAALGLGVDHDTGFPAYFGQAPQAEGETEAAADMIGQGKILASPMTMATVAASVQSGTTVVPSLVRSHDTQVTAPAVPLTKGEAAQLRELMRAVVTDGSGRFLADLPGAAVGAKTGTAEYGKPGKDGKLPTHTWMIATRGDLAVAVFVENGQSGSGTAGPVLEAFLR